MYSVVLMAALTAGTASPSFGFRQNYWSSYPAFSCSGCCGCGGSWTYGGYGFAGGGYGYHGGCYGGYGAWYGDVGNGCTGCYGCYGGYAGYGTPIPAPTYNPLPISEKPPEDPFPPINPKKDDKIIKVPEEVEQPKEVKPKKVDGPQVRGKIYLDIPEGGKLYVDGQRINVPVGQRTFQTPPLVPGQKYFYDIRVVVESNGQIASDERRVIVQAGQNLAIAFPNLARKGTTIVKANE